MSLDSKVVDILTKQINKELFSAYLYVDFANYYEDRGLTGFANWYMIQSQEEVDHAMIIRRYLLDNDEKVVLEALEKPTAEYHDDGTPLKLALEHEQFITASINECYEVARSVKDYRTMQLLEWFISEQGEEETNATEMITKMDLFGKDCHGLYDLDREYAARTFTHADMPM